MITTTPVCNRFNKIDNKLKIHYNTATFYVTCISPAFIKIEKVQETKFVKYI